MKKATFLGCGSSTGVPLIGCHCQICKSLDPKNRRLRSSLLLEGDSGSWLIDVGPDFRQQALSSSLSDLSVQGRGSLKGILLTHAHADHVGGLDDLRVFNLAQKRALPLLLSQSCHQDLLRRYPYMFATGQPNENPRTSLLPTILFDLQGFCRFEDLPVEYLTHYQSGMAVLALRIGSFAYVTDLKAFGLDLIERLQGVETLVLSAGAVQSLGTVLNIEEAIDLAKKIGASRTFFTHMNHEIEYNFWQSRLPFGMSLAYDGLELDLAKEPFV